MRAFISIELPEEIKKEIFRLQDLLPKFEGKKTELENLHLTLKFLGEISEEQLEKIKKELKEVKAKSFKASLGELGVFSPRFVKIIWIKLLGCEKLQEEIDIKLKNLFPKEKRFMSHITIARVKQVKERKSFIEEIKRLKTRWLEFPIEKFTLRKSTLTKTKPVYEDIEVYQLE